MGIPVLIIGKSGSGKSRSLKRCIGKDFGVIRVLNKPLPFRGKILGNVCSDYTKIKAAVKSAQWPKSIVIDDAGYLITGQFMDGHNTTGKGNAVFSLYNQLADDFYRLIRSIADEAPPDRIVYVIMHEDTNEFGDIKPKTIGKLLDEKVCLEGMFTIVLRAVKGERYMFVTQSRDGAVSKSPDDMFPEIEIDNDLLYVDDTIREYYGIENPKNKEQEEQK
ncbi:MAG TPA: AAA family ATPase [Candidatus Choladousia intestinavium]|uniref:AAA family ATPase n=1 Tax=Candidatus Choladousia intestinavium TaxID=2840727 RepID=A0A9D1AAT3_9FIRM|nr:AAA family ATPase [Candidatus Choladousia intestinavium]